MFWIMGGHYEEPENQFLDVSVAEESAYFSLYKTFFINIIQLFFLSRRKS